MVGALVPGQAGSGALSSRESSAVFSVFTASPTQECQLQFPGIAHMMMSANPDIALPSLEQASISQPSEKEAGRPSKGVATFCGHRIHLTLVRSYSAPTDVAWNYHTFDTRFFGMLYTDRTVSDQFLVFYKRSFVTLFVGAIYCTGLLLSAVVPLITRRFIELWLSAAVVMFLAVLVDGWAHFFADLTPTVARIRMGVSLTGCVVFVTAASWAMWSAQAHCDEANLFPHYPGRKVFDNTADLLRHCRVFMEPMPIIAAASSLGLSLHPIVELPLMVLFAFLNIFVGRWYADVHEPTSERLMKAMSILIAAGGAAALTILQFSATRAAFETAIRIEAQRQEAERRAAELEHLLTTIVPAAVLPRLLAGGRDQFTIDEVECASMLFADMKGFTAWSSSRSAVQVTSMLNTVVAAVDALAAAAVGVEKIKTVGDAYWAVAGIPVPHDSHADQLVLFAWHMNAAIDALNRRHAEWDGVAWRVAVHTGPMTGALFGERQVSYEVFGETARIAQLVETNGVPGALCVTQAVVDALFHSPTEIVPRLHRSLQGELPHGHVLHIFELPPPLTGTTSPPAVSLQHSHSLQRSHSIQSGLSIHTALSASMSGAEGSDSLHGAVSFPALSPKSTKQSRRGSLYLAASTPQRRPPRLPSFKSASEPGKSLEVASEGRVTEAAAEEMVSPKWRFLPWFGNEELEATFKARCETVVRPNARAAAVLSFLAHALSMAAGFGEDDPCYTTPSISLQAVAALGFVVALAITLHPRGPLPVAGYVTAAAVAASVTGLGIAALGGCLFAHDVLWLCMLFTIPRSFAVGPLSWPVFAVGVWVSAMAPALPLTLLHSPSGPANAVLSGVGAGVLSVCLAYVQETSLRRRFVEEKLSQRCEQQLQSLGEERVVVLQRLVPHHVVDDLIAWFGTGMDPLRSIARSYDAVVVAFLQLRPHAVSDLALLHAEIDRDLDTANGDIGAERILDKIKTVGDVVMLAGPFAGHHRTAGEDGKADDSGSSKTDIAAAFGAVLTLARAVQRRCPLRLGAHVGPVVGTVQGSSRLAFDTFGDAVNVASRVMSSATAALATDDQAMTAAALRVSVELHDVIVGSPLASSVPFGGPVAIKAKGKGDLVVFPVLCDVLA